MSDRNQDKEKREKQGDPEQDESVLNPERKDELDLSKKERRLIEKEKLKGMGIGKKLEYIWMYYKPVIFGVIAAIALVFGVRDYYEGLKVKTVLSVAVVDSRSRIQTVQLRRSRNSWDMKETNTAGLRSM